MLVLLLCLALILLLGGFYLSPILWVLVIVLVVIAFTGRGSRW